MNTDCKNCSYRPSCSNQIRNSGFSEKQEIRTITGEIYHLAESDHAEVLENPSHLVVLLTGQSTCLYSKSMFTPLENGTPPWSLYSQSSSLSAT